MPKEFSDTRELSVSVSEYGRLFAGDDTSFGHMFHAHKRHQLCNDQGDACNNDVETGWQIVKLDDDSCDNSSLLNILKSMDVPVDSDTLRPDWRSWTRLTQAKKDFAEQVNEILVRHESFKLPLPIPSAMQRAVFGSVQHGHRMQSLHVSPSTLLSDGSLFIETRSRPAVGMLASKFSVHLTYLVTPLEDSRKCLLNVTGRVEVKEMMMKQVIETFALPFCKKLHMEWVQMVISYIKASKE